MSCASCRNRVRKSLGFETIPVYPDKENTLSAATLTPDGWTSTCFKCGKHSEPQPFKHLIKAACQCKR